jgi:integrase
MNVYRYQLRATLRSARRISGRTVTPVELFGDAYLLGRALVDEVSTTGTRLSKWTLAQRRSAVRSFAAMMRPELLPLLGAEPSVVVDRALQEVAERVGGGYRVPGGRPRRRGGSVPTPDEVDRVLAVLGRAPRFVGLRNRAFFGLLVATGCRVNALRSLDGTDCVLMPNGRLRLYLHEKGKAERREVELSQEMARDVQTYREAFNRHAGDRGLQTRVRIGEPGAMWQNAAGRTWSYSDILTTLRAGCAGAGVTAFTPYALRRAFATQAASRLPRHIVALAGGWNGLERLDNHYVRPQESVIWQKLGGPGARGHDVDTEPRLTDAPVVIV